MDDIGIRLYETICRHDGITAKEIAREIGVGRTDVNRLLYASPFVNELCYRDDEYRWHALIQQMRPHSGLYDFCGYYDSVPRFLSLSEEEWMDELQAGCRRIGRNLNDTRGLFHSFRDTRQTILALFDDMKKLDVSAWEICFELRIKRTRHIRIYADVLVITEDKVFSLEFKMKDTIEAEELEQSVKYARYLDVIFGSGYEVFPALVLTKAADLYKWEYLPDGRSEVQVCSGDMLFNVFDEFLGFLDQ